MKIGEVKKLQGVDGHVQVIVHLNILALSRSNFVISCNQSVNSGFYLHLDFFDSNGNLISSYSFPGYPNFKENSIALGQSGDVVFRYTDLYGQTKYKLYSVNGFEINISNLYVSTNDILKIELTKINSIGENNKEISAIDANNNVFQIFSTSTECTISGFEGTNGTNKDMIYFSFDNPARRNLNEKTRFLQSFTNSVQSQVQYKQLNTDTIITIPKYPELKITLRNYSTESLNIRNFV
jgi:hypothetical protein